MALTPTGPALTLATVSVVLLTFSWIVVTLRFVARRRMKSIGMDDWLMLAGLVFFTLACQATISGSFNGVGTDSEYITDYYDKKGRMWFMFFQFFYVLSTVPIKSAICVTLLRITPSLVYRYILYTVIFLSAVACIVTDVTVLAWCKPVAATWDKSKGTCADASVITNVSFFISAVSILTDWTCAILPAFILWDVQLRFRIKASVAVVLSLGVLASSATIVRLRYLLAYNDPSNYLKGIADIAIWSITESGVGLIAGSLATLRPLLRAIPFFDSVFSSARTRTRETGTNGVAGQSHRLDTLRLDKSRANDTVIETGDNGWDRLSDSGSQRYMLNEGQITVTKDVIMSHSEGSEEDTPKPGAGRR